MLINCYLKVKMEDYRVLENKNKLNIGRIIIKVFFYLKEVFVMI